MMITILFSFLFPLSWAFNVTDLKLVFKGISNSKQNPGFHAIMDSFREHAAGFEESLFYPDILPQSEFFKENVPLEHFDEVVSFSPFSRRPDPIPTPTLNFHEKILLVYVHSVKFLLESQGFSPSPLFFQSYSGIIAHDPYLAKFLLALGESRDKILKYLEAKRDGKLLQSDYIKSLTDGAQKAIETVKMALSRKIDYNLENVTEVDIASISFPTWSLLHEACGDGNLNLVKLLMSRNDSSSLSEIVTAEGLNALHIAAFFGHSKIVSFLLEQNTFNHSAVTKDGWTILHCAFHGRNRKDVVPVVLNGDSINYFAIDNNGQSILDLACAYDDLPSLKLIVGKVDDRDEHSVTAFMNEYGKLVKIAYLLEKKSICDWLIGLDKFDLFNNNDAFGPLLLFDALHSGNYDLVQLILKRKDINFNELRNKGLNFFHSACVVGHLNTVNILLKRKDIDISAVSANGMTALEFACLLGHEEVVKSILYYKPTCISSSLGRGLHFAAYNGNVNLVNLLIKYKADVSVSYKGWTALLIASRMGHIDVVKALLSPSTVSAVTEKGANALHLASVNGSLELVELLWKQSNQTAVTYEGLNYLHISCSSNNLDVASWLLDQSVINTLDTTKDGWSLLHYVAAGGSVDLAKMILNRTSIGLLSDDNSVWSPFHIASFYGNLDVLTEFLKLSNDIDPKGWTLLHSACLGKQLEVVKYILGEKYLDLSVVNEDGWNSLHVAAFSGDLKLVEFLTMREDLSVSSLTADGYNPLLIAAEAGNDKVVNFLMNLTDFRKDAVTADGFSALHLAVEGNFSSLVQLILERDWIDVNMVSKDGWTPLHLATIKGHVEIIQLLLQSPNINVSAILPLHGLTALHLAAMAGNVEVMKLLADRTVIHPQSFSPLHIAILNSHWRSFQFLLHHTDHFNAATKEGISLLHVACLNPKVKFAKLLLENNSVNSSTTAADGWTCLHVASSVGNVNVLKLILQNHTVNVNVAERDGLTALHLASRNGHLKAVRMLLHDSNINVNPAANDGSTPLHFASKEGHDLVVRVLLKHKKVMVNLANDYSRTALHEASSNGHAKVVSKLLTIPCIDINAFDSNGYTALHDSVLRGHYEVVKLLLDTDEVDVNAQELDSLGSPLYLAVQKNDVEIVKLLIKAAKVNVNQPSRDGSTPLLTAIMQGYSEIALEILSHPLVKVSFADSEGKTLLQLAHERKLTLVFDVLLQKGAFMQYFEMMEKQKDLKNELLSQISLNNDRIAELEGQNVKNQDEPLVELLEHQKSLELSLQKLKQSLLSPSSASVNTSGTDVPVISNSNDSSLLSKNMIIIVSLACTSAFFLIIVLSLCSWMYWRHLRSKKLSSSGGERFDSNYGPRNLGNIITVRADHAEDYPYRMNFAQLEESARHVQASLSE